MYSKISGSSPARIIFLRYTSIPTKKKSRATMPRSRGCDLPDYYSLLPVLMPSSGGK